MHGETSRPRTLVMRPAMHCLEDKGSAARCHQSTCFTCAKRLQRAGDSCPICRAAWPHWDRLSIDSCCLLPRSVDSPLIRQGSHRPGVQAPWRLRMTKSLSPDPVAYKKHGARCMCAGPHRPRVSTLHKCIKGSIFCVFAADSSRCFRHQRNTRTNQWTSSNLKLHYTC